MTEKPTESDREAQETTEQPTPVVPSVPSDVQPTSAVSQEDVRALRDEVRKVMESIPELVERGIQSTKDKRLDVLGELDPQLLRNFKAYLEKHGDFDTAVREMEIDQLIAGRTSPEPVPGRTDPAVTGRMERYARRLLVTMGRPVDDAQWNAFIGSYHFTSEEKFYDDSEAWSETLKKQEATSPASAVVEGGGPAATGTTHDALLAEYQERLDKLPQGSVREIANLKAEYRKKGLGVW